jgi:peroxiredoxin
MPRINKGDQLPDFSLQVAGGEKLNLPSDITTDYAIILFYRGHWWPFCRRLLDGYEQRKAQFDELGTSLYAASVDPLEKALEVGEPLSFSVAWGVERELGNMLGSFWDEERDFIQPTEFIVNQNGKVLSSTYSSSPVGRTDPEEALVLLKFLASRK